MKTIINILLLFFFANCLLSQKIDRYQLITDAEYFINIDPGEGKGNAINVSQGFNVDISIDNIQYSQSDIIFVRVKNEKGIWSAPLGKKLGTNFIKEARVFKVTYPNPNYRVEIEVKASIENKKLNGLIASAMSDPLNGDDLKPGDTLLVQFRGNNGIWGPKYEVILAKPDLQISKPYELSAEQIVDSEPKVKLSWNHSLEAVNQFSIERMNNNKPQDGWKEIGKTEKEQTEFYDVNIVYNTEYQWRVRAFGVKDWMHSDYSNIASITMVGINENSNIHIFSIIPIPATDIISISNIKVDAHIYENILIYNILGEFVSKVEYLNSSMQDINISYLPPGVYFLSIGEQANMFIKQ